MESDIRKLSEFREKLHESFPKRADAVTDLIDAASCNSSAGSPVELSLNTQFQRQYGSIYDAVKNFFKPDDPQNAEQERTEHQQALLRILVGQYPAPVRRNFHLFGLATTGYPRPFADPLADRGINSHPNLAPGNKPTAVGHNYSVLTALPEKDGNNSPPWVIPLLIRRVPTDKKSVDIGAAQVADVLKDETLPFGVEFCALVGDSSYSAREFLGQVVEHRNLASIIRVRGNRVFNRKPEQNDSDKKKGHPRWYGAAFDMKDPSTWGKPDAGEVVPVTLKNGRDCRVRIEAWHDLLMRGKRNIPMHKHPFTLIRITVEDNDGKSVFGRPLWLIIIGERRHEISPVCAYDAYRQRYDMEHFFRFGKNNLLLTSYQTPDVGHEENWWEIVGLAYIQLYAGAPLAQNLPRPWERWLPGVGEIKSGRLASPSMVQRDMPRILQAIGTPAEPPEPRGKSPGRKEGYHPAKRERRPIIIKGNGGSQKNARAP
ncbi:MAG: transposase [Chloroflexi bacterium]|nr:transposase [Chloroflexota bacterium]